MPRQLEAQVCRINQAPPDNKEVLGLKDRGGGHFGLSVSQPLLNTLTRKNLIPYRPTLKLT